MRVKEMRWIGVLCLLALLPRPADAQKRPRRTGHVLGTAVADTGAAARLPGTPVPAGPNAGDGSATLALDPTGLLRNPDPGFREAQLLFPRVQHAQVDAKFTLKSMFRKAELAYPPYEMFLRVFKHEQSVEVWVRPSATTDFTLLKSYPICALPGRLGPKQRAGDFQVPEGFYFVESFNPNSDYYLSLRLNYPNDADRMRGETSSLGGDIFIHGGCKSVGCVPVQDDAMKEIYWLAVEVRANGQTRIPVHIFPTRMNADGIQWLRSVFSPNAALLDFWHNLQEGYAYFQRTHQVPRVDVDALGRYAVRDPRVLDVAQPDTEVAAHLPPIAQPRVFGPRQ